MVDKAESKPFDGTAYKNSFNAENYDRFSLIFPKGERDRVKAFAKSNGESLNAFVLRAIREAMNE